MRALAFALLATLIVAQTTPKLTGRWRSLETSRGGIGAMYDFHNDGTFAFSPGAVVEMNYRIEGDQLIMPPAKANGPEQRQSMKWETPDRLVLDGTTVLSRQGVAKDPQNPIVGEWTTPREMSGMKMEARYQFTADGKTLFLLPFTVQKGSYTVKDATIRIGFQGAPVIEGPVHIDGDVLTIPGPRGTGESHFKRY